VYGAVGSTSNYAAFVDQGTGVYAGNAPYEAKILPPWKRLEPSLYESTWKPGAKTVDPVMIKGQPGQFFFDKGLKRAFQSMRMRSFQVPGDAQIAKALSELPPGLSNFVGATPSDAAFKASLDEWRSWRDAAWSRHEQLGRGAKGQKRSQVLAQQAAAARAQNRATANKTAAQRKSAAEAEKTALRIKVERARKKIATDKVKEEKAQRRTANTAASKNAKRARASQKAIALERSAREWAITNHIRTAQMSTRKDNGIIVGIKLNYKDADGKNRQKTFGKFN
jgi:hypothetical protein